MGAWGLGHFENDAALDFVYEIEESTNPKQVIIDALDAAIDAAYPDADQGCSAIVSATYIDRQLNGTKYSLSDGGEPLKVDTFPDRYPSINFADLRQKALNALKEILSDKSELNELWAENEELYPLWRQEVQELYQRLNK